MSETVYKVGDPAPPPLPRRSEAEIMARWQGKEPVVSILCPTYQHVDFIEDALRGFLGQDTHFPFEILVRDDASTDGTAEIVRDYAERYPNIIRAVLETENQYPKVKPLQVLLPMALGQFIAFCEGDDYWTDAYHLQRSVSVLSKEADVVATVARCIVVRDGRVVDFEAPDPGERWNYYLPIRSLVHRAEVPIPEIRGASGDMRLALALQRAGIVAKVDEGPVAVHLKHGGGIHGGLDYAHKKIANVEQLLRIAVHLAEAGDLELAEQYRSYAEMKTKRVLLDFLPKMDGSQRGRWRSLRH